MLVAMSNLEISKSVELFPLPTVHLEPVHPAAHAQVFGAVQLPPFGQDVALEHRAEI